jgi:hypothetical protein
MGYRCGALLANMESVEATLTPKGFSTQGLNALVSLGANFVNAKGERYTLPAFYRQKGVNFREQLVEISVSELSMRRSGV